MVNKHLLSVNQASSGVGNPESTESWFFPTEKVPIEKGTGGLQKGRLGQVGRASFEDLSYGTLQTTLVLTHTNTQKTVGDFLLEIS